MIRMPARIIYVEPEVHERPNCRERFERMRPLTAR